MGKRRASAAGGVLRRQLARRHGTAVAYVALFFALTGTGWAAATIARGPAVRVTCTATRGGRRIGCAVVGTKAGPTGPRGPQGARGPAGPAGPSGALGLTSLTEPPGYQPVSGTMPLEPGGGSIPGNDELQTWTAFNDPSAGGGPVGPVGESFQTDMPSPSALGGNQAHLVGVQFCYGAETSGAASITITSATIDELEEPPVAETTPTPATPPPYVTVPLYSTALNLHGQGGCQTLTPSKPPAIDSSGYLSLNVGTSFSAAAIPAGQTTPWTAAVSFGRVSATFSP